jgi:type II secretory pathway component PulF
LAQKLADGYSVQDACRDLSDFDPVLQRLLPVLGDNRLIKVLEFYTGCLINLNMIKMRLQTAFFYPLVVLCILVVNLVYLNISLFPHVISAHSPGGRSLPFMIRLLHFTEPDLWPLSLIVPFVILVSAVILIKTFLGMIDADSFIVRIYGVAAAVRLQETARLQSLISLYLKAGLPLEQSLENSAALAGKIDADDLLSVSRVLSQGQPVEEALAYSDVFLEIAHADLAPEFYAEKLEYAAESNFKLSCARIRQSSQNMSICALLAAGLFVALITSGIFDTYYWLIWIFS